MVTELASVLGMWGRPVQPRPRATAALDPERPDAVVQALVDAIKQTSVEATGAASGAVVLAQRRDDDDRALRMAVAIARDEQRPLVIVDRSSESIFGTPYNDLRGDDEYRPRPDRLFGAATAVREGRAATARAITAATAVGVEAGAWFPTRAGSDGLAEAIGTFDGSLLVLPASVRRPSGC